MVAFAIAKNDKAEIQIDIPPQSTSRDAPAGITRFVPFDAVKEVIESGRAPRRPNRNRPLTDDELRAASASRLPSDDELSLTATEIEPTE